MYVQVHVYMYVYVEARGSPQVMFFRWHCLPGPHLYVCLFKRQGLSLTWSLPSNRLDWPWRPRDLGSAWLYLPCVEITSVPPHLEFELMSCYAQAKNVTIWANSLSPSPPFSLRSSQIISFQPLMTQPLDVTVTLCSCHCYGSCFALHKRKCQGLRDVEAHCQHQRQLQKQPNFKHRNKRRHTGWSCYMDSQATLSNRFKTPSGKLPGSQVLQRSSVW